ncbi:MAG: hypothetical protein IK132_14685 [Clostridia bacterium]|nr:hypothetical protein [Clostridia bacterium]
MEGNLADIRCPHCGAPAEYDIVGGRYLCAYCGSRSGIGEVQAQRLGFRSLQQERIRKSAEKTRLMRANCTGCGASVVIEEGEAAVTCAFCGRALVREEYLASTEMPELIIPFRITADEAKACLLDWCRANAKKPEAKHLGETADTLTGVYLPYELVRGPVSCRVSRMDASRIYTCGGFVDRIFVNCSKQLDNLLLDAMEPFELEDLREFDFAYTAGQRIKIKDIDAGELERRVAEEVSNDYAPVVRKTLESSAVNVNTDPSGVLRMPVLLPVYYIASGKTVAAVNGQTGRVSVRAEKPSHHVFIPWWVKALLATVLITGAAFGAFLLFGMEKGESLLIAGMLGLITAIVTLAAFSDTVRNRFRVEAGHKIFTSSGGPLRRTENGLVRDPQEIRKEVTPPVFFETLDGVTLPVKLVFSSPLRTLKTVVLSVLALFLPVIVALFLNGFDFERLTLGGSAVWFCIMVPVVPIYILKFAVIELYENPWIYPLRADGKKKRYRKKTGFWITKKTVLTVLKVLFVPPISLAVWFGIASFCVMCYLTAFGFD